MNVRVLSRKEGKEVLGQINSSFGSSFDTELVLFQSGDDLFCANRSVFDALQPDWRVNSLGLYLGERKGDAVRLSIEGSQMVGASATRNIVDLDASQVRQWLAGSILRLDHPDTPYVLIRHDAEFYGCGKVKEGNLLNYVPKSRRISAV